MWGTGRLGDPWVLVRTFASGWPITVGGHACDPWPVLVHVSHVKPHKQQQCHHAIARKLFDIIEALICHYGPFSICCRTLIHPHNCHNDGPCPPPVHPPPVPVWPPTIHTWTSSSLPHYLVIVYETINSSQGVTASQHRDIRTVTTRSVSVLSLNTCDTSSLVTSTHLDYSHWHVLHCHINTWFDVVTHNQLTTQVYDLSANYD